MTRHTLETDYTDAYDTNFSLKPAARFAYAYACWKQQVATRRRAPHRCALPLTASQR